MAISFLQKLDLYPPVRCRLLAVRYAQDKRYQWPIPLTDDEIADRSGLPLGKVEFMSRLTDWNHVSVGEMRQFLKGCRLNLTNWASFARTNRLAQRDKFDYLRRHSLWPTLFEPLLKLWHHAGHQS